MGFSNERNARRVMSVLSKRLGKYGLTIHTEQTRLVYFRPPPECRLTRARRPAASDFWASPITGRESRQGRWW